MSCSCGAPPSFCNCTPCPSFGGGCPVDPDPLRVVTRSTAEGEPVREALRGDAVVFEVVVQRSPSAGAAPAPVNITGWSAWCTLKLYVDDPDNRAVSQVTVGTGITFTAPTSGRMRVAIPGSATALFPDGPVRVHYSVRVRDTSGADSTVEVGTIVVRPHATRAG